MNEPLNHSDEPRQPAGTTVSLDRDARQAYERGPQLVGTSIGPYRLMERIGEGGFGLVFVAEQQRPVKRKVALKLIKPGMDTREVIARFEAERQALALMDHSHIARVFDAGTTDSGHPYFVMELVRGVSITAYCDQNRLTLRERLELFVTVCQAIQHAHQKGIIHRDIKPSNVLVTLHDGSPVAKVIDFGVAKALHQQLTDKTIYTSAAQIVGTLRYMSPEQAKISGLDIDTRTDIYSLGVVLYELITGTTPFDHTRLANVEFDEQIRIIRHEEPPKPSTRLRQFSETLPSIAARRRIEPAKLSRMFRGDLDWITMKALDKDRTRRYETASALAADVLHYLRDEPVEATPPSTAYLLKKFARRYRTILATGTAFIAILLAGIAATAWFAVRAEQLRQKADENAQDALHEAENARSAKTIAETAQRAEAAQRQKTQEALDRSEKSLYLDHIALADRNWQANNSGRAGEILNACPATFRDWEWHYLNRLVHSEVMTLSGDNLAYSPDGKLIATSDLHGQDAVCVRDAQTGTIKTRLKGSHPVPFLQCLAFSPDSRRLAAICQDRAIWIWNLSEASQPIQVPIHLSQETLSEPLNRPVGLAFSPDGRRIAVAGVESEAPNQAGVKADKLVVWDTATGKVLFEVSNTGKSVAFSPDGKRLATTHFDFVKAGATWTGPITGGIHILDAETGRVATRLPPWRGEPDLAGGDDRHITYSPDGKWLASVRRSDIKIWDPATAQEIRTLRGHGQFVTTLSFSSDSDWLVSGSLDETVRLWNRQRGQSTVYHGNLGAVTGVSFSPDGRRVASAAEDGIVRIWDATTGQEGREIPGTAGMNGSIAISPDGRFVACLQQTPGVGPLSDGRFKLVLVDATSGREVRLLRSVLPLVSPVRGNLSFSSDGRLLAFALENEVQVWDIVTGQETAHFSGVANIARRGLAFSPDGRRLAFTAQENSVEVWEIGSHQRLTRFTGHNAPVTTIAFSKGGNRIASGSLDQTVKVWDASNGHEIFNLPRATSGVANIAFSPDGKCLLTSGSDKCVHAWDLEKGTEYRKLHGHKSSSWCIAFNNTGTRLVTGGADSVLTLWSWPACEEILSIPGQHRPMLAAFINEGSILAAASNSGVTIWNATPISASERVQE